MISKETAFDIAMAYREIEAAEKLLADVKKANARGIDREDIRDSFGRTARGLQLGVPNGPGSSTLFDVPWELCRPIIEGHIAACRDKISVLNAKAKIEADTTQASKEQGNG
jgi:hypothetical protein